MHQTLCTVVLLSTVSFADQALLHRAGQKAGPMGADCGRHTTDRNVCVDCPDPWHPFTFKNDACKIPKGPQSNAVALQSASTGENMQAVERFNARLLLDSKVVDLPLSYNPIVVALFSLKPSFCNGFQKGGMLLGPWWSIRPRNPITAPSEIRGSPGKCAL